MAKAFQIEDSGSFNLIGSTRNMKIKGDENVNYGKP